jgi:hypothetical protein
MDPKQNGTGSVGNNPPPQIIKPSAPVEGPDKSPVPDTPADEMFAANAALVSDIPEPPSLPDPQPLPAPPSPPQPPAPEPPVPPAPPASGAPFTPDTFVRTPQAPEPNRPQPIQPAPSNTSPPDTSNLFQPDSKLPEIKYPGQGSVIVDNRPPRGIKRLFAKPKSTFIVLAPLVLALIIGGFVFGYYLPNRPGAIWNTGLDRSGQALDTLLTEATDKQQFEQYKKSEVKATMDVKYQGNDLSGSFTGRFDDSKADGELKFTGKENGSAAVNLGMKVISILADGATYPDSYIQLNGLKALGADNLAPGVSQYDGKWISVEAKYLESLGLPVPSADKKKNDTQINAGDISEVIRTTSAVAKDYVLTSDKDRALIEQRSFVGKEKVDGITAYHYKAGINKSHGEQFCTAYSDKLAETGLYKKLNHNDQAKINKSRDNDIKSCKKDFSGIKDSETFDIWIGGKYKLIHKIRVTDDKNKDSYWDIGQDYNGGDEISLFSNYHYAGDNPIDVSANFTTNIKTVDSKGTLAVNYGKGNDAWQATASFEIKPLSGGLDLQKPADSIPIQTILKQYGLDTTDTFVNDSIYSGQQAQAKDADRKADINTIYSYVEVYFAQNGYYPSSAQINNPGWRASNMKDLDSSALAPPGSSATTLATSASSSQYGYSPSGCNSAGEQCSNFILEALLDTGGKYTKYGSNLTITTTNPSTSPRNTN